MASSLPHLFDHAFPLCTHVDSDSELLVALVYHPLRVSGSMRRATESDLSIAPEYIEL